jgi:hypothetical protein
VRFLFLILPVFSVLKSAEQSNAFKGFTNETFPHYPKRSWSHGVSVGLLDSLIHCTDSPHPSHRESTSYHEAKQAATTYQAAKRRLIGPNAPFAGWVVSGEEWESFDVHGNLRSDKTRQPEQDMVMCKEVHGGSSHMILSVRMNPPNQDLWRLWL